MTAQKKSQKALKIGAAWLALGMILACGGNDDDDSAPTVAQIQLAPGFTPQTATGTAGGAVQATTHTNNAPGCLGFINASANHQINVTQAIATAQIAAVVQAANPSAASPEDLTLVVRLPTGQYVCNDDGGTGFNPLVSAALPVGVTQVFVGTYNQPQGTPAPTYTLTISGGAAPVAAAAAPAVPAPTVGGIVSLTPGFMPDPQTRTGVGGGNVAANTMNPSCRGYIGVAPSATLSLSADFRNLRILVNSAEDTTLVVRRPDGQYMCDDDGGEGLNPMVQGAMARGIYQVYVGSYMSGRAPNYVLGFSELSSVTANNLR